jgi:CRP-like cAMP-binding protein
VSVAQVLGLLSEIASILEKHSVAHWEGIILARLESLRTASQTGNERHLAQELQEIRGLYGGMGSFSDVYVTDRAGDKIDAGQVRSVNSRLQRLRTELFISVGREMEQLGDSGGDILT